MASKSISNRQLKEVVAQYATLFPGWQTFVDGTAFVRHEGPIEQVIWFQKMSYPAYRPAHGIRALSLPKSRMLAQILDVKNREIDFRSHEQKWRDVVVAMEHQFKPDIRKPIDAAELLSLCKASARPNVANDLAMLAILYAWLGQKAAALSACAELQQCPPPKLAPVPEWEEEMKAFGRWLAEAVRDGRGQEFLKHAALKKP